MSGKWTPGPWAVMNSTIYNTYVGVRGPCTVAAIRNGANKKTRAETDANATLIAAAPELYEALFNLMNCFAISKFEPDPGQPSMLKDGIYDKHMRAAQVALHKARGGP